MNRTLKTETAICENECSEKPAGKVEVKVKAEAKASCTLGRNS
jgi:hypothetical protein